MLTTDIAALFRYYVDANSPAYLSDQDAIRFLRLGDQDFRTSISNVTDNFLTHTLTLNVVPSGGQTFIDLNGICIGPAPLTAPELVRMVRVTLQAPAVRTPPTIALLSSYESWLSALRTFQLCAYLDQSSGRLWINSSNSGPIGITYIRTSPIDWATAISNPVDYNESGVAQFAELVALYAAQRYFVLYGTPNPALEAQIDRTSRSLSKFLNQNSNNQRQIAVRMRSPGAWR